MVKDRCHHCASYGLINRNFLLLLCLTFRLGGVDIKVIKMSSPKSFVFVRSRRGFLVTLTMNIQNCASFHIQIFWVFWVVSLNLLISTLCLNICLMERCTIYSIVNPVSNISSLSSEMIDFLTCLLIV